MKQEVKIGQTDYTVLILVRDSTTGAPKTALTFESAGIDVCYTRVETDNDVVTTDGAPVTTTLTGAHVDWGFVLVDDTKCPGLYKLDIADGVFATGAWSAVVSFICTGCDPVHIEFVLVPESPYTGVNASQVGGLTVVSGCIPNAVAGAAGGLFIAGTNAATTVTTALTTTFTGNLTGSVASVATGGIAAASFAAGAITAAAIATDAIDADAIAADAVVELANGNALLTGIAQAGSTYSNIVLAASGPSAVDDYYNGCLVEIYSGTGAGQARLITDYTGSSKIAIVDNPWATAPGTGCLYRIMPFSGYMLADTGTAQAWAAATITLATTAPAVTDAYVGHTIFISSGTGIGQARLITAYANTRIATVSPAWTTVPDATSVYEVIPVGRTYVNAVAADAISASSLATDAVTEIADGILARDLGSGTGAGTLNERTVRAALRFLRNKWTAVGTTLTVKKEDDTADAWAATLTHSAAAEPITEIDPT